MKTILKIVSIIMLIFIVCINATAQNKIKATKGKKIRLGALYKIDVKGRHNKGIQRAVDDLGMESFVEFVSFEYLDEEDGLKKLIEIIQGGKVDIVLGPTDSGVFLKALEQFENLNSYQIPVISSLVTAPIENKEDGWFFRTNVDVQRRVETIYDFLNKYWIRSITVLYADTEFGRLAESTFRKELRGNQKKNYQALKYKASIEARPALKQILDSRPEAIGIFGSNEEIIGFCNSLRSMNPHINPYKPILFTIIDARETAEEKLYFVSLAEPDIPDSNSDNGQVVKLDEVEALAYDTAILVLNVLQEMSNDRFSPQRFRQLFASFLNGPFKIPDSNTGMQFNKYKNIAKPRVFQIQSNQVKKIAIGQAIGWNEKLNNKWELIRGRYGLWPILGNIVLLILVVVVLSILDLKRWYEGKFKKLISHFHFYLLIIINVALAFGLYVFLAETGKIRYDSIITVLIIAITPSAVLKTTFFETQTGKSIGLANLYDRFLAWINDKLMMAKYRSQNSNVNVIAYNNSLTDMKSELNQIYQNARNVSQYVRLQSELEEELQKADSHLERCRICARRLLSRLDWEELMGKRLVPEAFSDKNPIDPRIIVRESVHYCLKDLKRMARVENLIKDRLNEVKKSYLESHLEMEKELNQDMQDTQSARGKLFVQIRFLLVQVGFNQTWMKEKDLLPEEYEISLTDTRSFWRRKWDTLRTWLRSKKTEMIPKRAKM